MQIRIFIDYDNLGAHKSSGLSGVVNKALLAMPLDTTDALANCDVRVYGGWYSGHSLTQRAQDVVIELGKDFPLSIRCPTTNGTHCAVTATAEIARALSIEPSNPLLDTFRRHKVPNDLQCSDPAQLGCTLQNCQLAALPVLFSSAKCPMVQCSITLNQMLFRHEQKQVDTMLTCDIIYACRMQSDFIIVVSNDDDLLPGIRTASLQGVSVLRLHPKNFVIPTPFPATGAYITELRL